MSVRRLGLLAALFSQTVGLPTFESVAPELRRLILEKRFVGNDLAELDYERWDKDRARRYRPNRLWWQDITPPGTACNWDGSGRDR